MLRLKERIEVAEKALESFESSLLPKKPTLIERDGAIQRFEFTVEAVWKTAQRYLQIVEGLQEGSPKGVIRRLREIGFFDDSLAMTAL